MMLLRLAELAAIDRMMVMGINPKEEVRQSLLYHGLIYRASDLSHEGKRVIVYKLTAKGLAVGKCIMYNRHDWHIFQARLVDDPFYSYPDYTSPILDMLQETYHVT